MNDSSSSLDIGLAGDPVSESIQDQIQNLFQEIIGHHSATVKRKNASKWYGQLDNIIIQLNSITNNNLQQQKGKRKRTDKEEKESDPKTPQSVASDFKWASNRPIHLNQSAQQRIEALNRQLAITNVPSMSPFNSEKQKKFKPVRPKQPEVALSPMKDISNIIKANGHTNTGSNVNLDNSVNSTGNSTMDVDDDNCDEADDLYLRDLDVTQIIADEPL